MTQQEIDMPGTTVAMIDGHKWFYWRARHCDEYGGEPVLKMMRWFLRDDNDWVGDFSTRREMLDWIKDHGQGWRDSYTTELTEVVVSTLPQCDFCDTPARYDGETDMGPWAYMCETHFRQHGQGLGLGIGQQLLLLSEFIQQREALSPPPLPYELKPGYFVRFSSNIGYVSGGAIYLIEDIQGPFMYLRSGKGKTSLSIPICLALKKLGRLSWQAWEA